VSQGEKKRGKKEISNIETMRECLKGPQSKKSGTTELHTTEKKKVENIEEKISFCSKEKEGERKP